MYHILVLGIALISTGLALYGLLRQMGPPPGEDSPAPANTSPYPVPNPVFRPDPMPHFQGGLAAGTAEWSTLGDGDHFGPVRDVAPEDYASEVATLVLRLPPDILRNLDAGAIETRPDRDGGLDVYASDRLLAHVSEGPRGRAFDLHLEPLPG